MSNGNFCANCGSPNEDDARFCEACGRELTEDVAPTAVAPRRRWSAKVVVPVVLLLLVAAGAFAFPAQFSSAMSATKGMLGLGSRVDTSTTQTVATPGGPSTVIPFGDTALTPPPGLKVAVSEPDEVKRAAADTEDLPVPRPIPPEPPARTKQWIEPAITRRDSAMVELPVSTSTETRPSSSSATTIPPEPLPLPPAPKLIAAGTTLQLKSLDKVCTDKNKQDDMFRTVVDQPVEGSSGARIPKGSVVTFIVDRLSRADGKVEFSISPLAVELNGVQAPIRASVDAVALKKANKGLLGAVVGAAAGIAAAKVAGGDARATVLGGAAGGAAGALIGKQLQNADGCIETNASIKITLRSDLTPP